METSNQKQPRFEAERGVQRARQTPLSHSLSPSRHSPSHSVPLVSTTRRQSTPPPPFDAIRSHHFPPARLVRLDPRGSCCICPMCHLNNHIDAGLFPSFTTCRHCPRSSANCNQPVGSWTGFSYLIRLKIGDSLLQMKINHHQCWSDHVTDERQTTKQIQCLLQQLTAEEGETTPSSRGQLSFEKWYTPSFQPTNFSHNM